MKLSDLKFIPHPTAQLMANSFDTIPQVKLPESLKGLEGIENLFPTKQDHIDSKLAQKVLENGNFVSVILGKPYYSNGIDTYELGFIIKGQDLEVIGYLNLEELERKLTELAE